jgi:glycosyltransferase involved in cell wall biosynthesis
MKIIYYDKSNFYSGAEKSLVSLIEGMNTTENVLLFNYPLDHHKYYGPTAKIYRNSKLKFWMGSDFSTNNLKGTDFLKRIIFAFQLFRILKKHKPDILHINLYRNTDVLDLKVARFCKVKCVIHVRSLLSQVDINNKVIKYADQIIATSNFVKNEVNSIDTALNVKAIYDPLDISKGNNISENQINDFKHQLIIEKHSLILASVGILDKRKGHDTAIEAAAELNKEFNNFRLFIAGGDLEKNKEELERLERLVEKNNLKSKVSFLGHVENIDLLYASSDFILALSRDGEAFGRVPLEAAKYKKVVIGTKMGATPEIVKHKETGFLVEPDDYKTVASHVITIKDDHSLLEKIGEKAYENLIKKFSAKAHCDNMLTVYEKLLLS